MIVLVSGIVFESSAVRAHSRFSGPNCTHVLGIGSRLAELYDSVQEYSAVNTLLEQVP